MLVIFFLAQGDFQFEKWVTTILFIHGIIILSSYIFYDRGEDVRANYGPCEIGGEILAKEKHLSDPSKYNGWSDWGCTRIPGNQYNAKFVYVGNAILSYLHNHEEDFGIINPFDPTNKIPVNQTGGCPNVDNVGRINAHIDENQNKVLLCVRYVVCANDIIQETMDNPY